MGGVINLGDKYKLLTGKYKGKVGYFMHYTKPFYLNNHTLIAVRVQTGMGWKTLLFNPDNLEEII